MLCLSIIKTIIKVGYVQLYKRIDLFISSIYSTSLCKYPQNQIHICNASILRTYFSIQKSASPPFIKKNYSTEQLSIYVFILFELNQIISIYNKSWTQTLYYKPTDKSINQKQCFDFSIFLSKIYNVAEKNVLLSTFSRVLWVFFFWKLATQAK